MKLNFHPVICLPPHYEIYDFSNGYDPDRKLTYRYGIGKYLEKREGMYVTPLFQIPAESRRNESADEIPNKQPVNLRTGFRNIHMGIDIGAPEGTSVHAAMAGEIFLFGNNQQPGDYGPTLVLRHQVEGKDLYVLYGHLSMDSIEGKWAGQKFEAGDVLGWVGDKSVNGGWNPHVHVQLSWLKPTVPDMPGAVSQEQLAEAVLNYPDPRLILGALY